MIYRPKFPFEETAVTKTKGFMAYQGAFASDDYFAMKDTSAIGEHRIENVTIIIAILTKEI